MQDSTVISLQVFSYLTSLILGFILGRMTTLRVSDDKIDARGSFFKPEAKKKAVVMDERRFVTDVSTSSLEKKSGDLGTSITVNDDVATSASRLAHLKKNR